MGWREGKIFLTFNYEEKDIYYRLILLKCEIFLNNFIDNEHKYTTISFKSSLK